jgi:hypothetical protein
VIAAVGWALIGVGAGIGITCLIALALGSAFGAADRRLVDIDDAPGFVDDIMAMSDGPRDRGPSHHAAPGDRPVGKDFELWRLECGW